MNQTQTEPLPKLSVSQARQHRTVQTMLDLCMEHMPIDERAAFEVEGLRTARHGDGWIVFVEGGWDQEEKRGAVPAWLLPMWDLALAADAILICFSWAAEPHDDFACFR